MKRTICYQEHSSPLGTLILSATDRGLCGIHFEDQRHFNGTESWKKASLPILEKTAQQLDDYFQGKRKEFDLTLDLNLAGTAFQQAVWHALLTVPFGQTSTYGAHAHHIEKPRAVRATGSAIGRNPISIVVPCHRILGSNNALTGYAGGLDRKKYLLQLEGILL